MIIQELYATAVFERGDVVGIYENAVGGQRRTTNRILDPANKSQYAVEHEGHLRDTWDEINEYSCCNSGYINDYHDLTMDDVRLGIHPLQPTKRSLAPVNCAVLDFIWRHFLYGQLKAVVIFPDT